jgi:ABC-type nitrate/sulfonate/bicarbonate transport system substrate-binding protein
MKMTRSDSTRWAAALTATVFAVGLAAACAEPEEAAEVALERGCEGGKCDDPAPAAPTTVAFAHPRATAQHWDLYVAEALGMFADEGIDLEVTELDPEQVIAAVSDGTFGIGSVATSQHILAQNAGAPVSTISGRIYAPDQSIIAPATTTSLAELAGGRIAFGQNPIYTPILREILADAGLEPGEYEEVIVSGSRARFDAMHADPPAYDAVVLGPPFNLTFDATRLASLASFTDSYPRLLFLGTVLNNAFGLANHDLVIGYMKAIIRAQRWLNDEDNRDEAILILADKLSITEEEAALTYDYFVLETRAFRFEGRIDAVGFKKNLTLLGFEPGLWHHYVDKNWYQEARAALAD